MKKLKTNILQEMLKFQKKIAAKRGLDMGILWVLNGKPFDRKQTAIFLLLNSGYNITSLAAFFSMSDKEIADIYIKVYQYYERIYSNLNNEDRLKIALPGI